jgi:hypothetical protein
VPARYFYFPLSGQDPDLQLISPASNVEFIIKATRERNLGVLGAYGHTGELLCVAPTIQEVLDLLRGLNYRGYIQIATALSMELLPDLSWERRIAEAANTIRTANAKGDERALGIFKTAATKTGVKRGPKRTEEGSDARIAELRRDMEGISDKEIAGKDETIQAVIARRLRFCNEIRKHYLLMGAPDLSKGCDEKFALWFKKKLKLTLPDDLPLIRHALHRCGVVEKPRL